MKIIYSVLLILWLLSKHGTYGIIGYDCGTSQMNVTTLSLLDVEPCNIPMTQPKIDKVYIQLLQISRFDSLPVVQCKVTINRDIFYCGMHSHISAVANGRAEYVADVTQDQCNQMHRTGALAFSLNNIIQGLKVNYTTSRPLLLAGSLTSDGKCDGAQYSDPFGTWNDVVVQAVITVTLRTHYASVNLETNQIHLKGGTTCSYTDSTCVDVDGAYAFWNSLPDDKCNSNHYDVLYEGFANRMLDTVYSQPEIVYSLSTQEVTFALTKTGEQLVCGYTLIRTEHPKLIIVETAKGNSFATRRRISVENLDIFAYVNSKFVYVEKHIRNQINQLYRDVLQQRCNLEQQVLKNALSIAVTSPDEFAYEIMKGPGYMAVIAGEVVHIIKCTPIEVRIRHEKECYLQLPVFKGNQTFFLSPRTHILIKKGTQVSCNRVIPPMYHLVDGWYRVIPTPEQAIPPTVMKPMTKPTWQYTNPGNLAASGIYSNQDLDQLRDHIMFPAERPAILNAMARGVQGQPTLAQGMSLTHLLDEDALDRIAQSTWNKIWGGFTQFGNVSAGLIGLFMCFRALKLVIDTIVHGYALHSIYGWSIHLLGAFWDSVANLLLHLAKRPQLEETKSTAPLIQPEQPDNEGQINAATENTEHRIEIPHEAEVSFSHCQTESRNEPALETRPLYPRL